MKTAWCAFGALASLTLPGCQGDGSDIGPNLGGVPPPGLLVIVEDDAGRPVSGVRVELGGSRAVTGRSGRAELFGVRPPAAAPCRIDATAASARPGDELVALTALLRPVADSRSASRPVVVPDLAASVRLTITAGIQAGPIDFDDPGAGVALDFAAGVEVRDGTAATVTLRVGQLEPRHLPAALPAASGMAPLVSRGIWIAPASATFAPGGTLTLADDLGLPDAATVDLLRLDPATGTFARIGTGTVAGGSLVSTGGAVDSGGLYVFAAAVPAASTTTALRGRILDRAGEPLRRVLVRGGAAEGITAADGRFDLGPLAAVDGGGAPRSEVLEFTAGVELLPARSVATVALVPGVLDIGDVTLDTGPAGTVRAIIVERGRVLTNQRIRAGSADGRTAGDGFADAAGRVFFEDQSPGFYGFRGGRPIDRLNLVRIEGFARLLATNRFADVRLFAIQSPWDLPRRGTNVVVVDAASSAPVAAASIVRGFVPQQGYVGETFESGALFVGLDENDHVTAVAATSVGGRRVFGARTVVDTGVGRVELPVRRASLPSVGAFQRYGLFAGGVSGGITGRDRRLRTTWPLSFADWFEAVVGIRPPGGTAVPIRVDPTVAAGPSTPFAVGVPMPSGQLALAEGVDGPTGFALERLALATGLIPDEGGVTGLDLSLAVIADRTFTAAGALSGLDGRIAAGDLRFDYGFAGGDGVVVDALRGGGGSSLVVAGSDVGFVLPPLTGVLAGGRHLVKLGAEVAAGGVTVSQQAVLRLQAPSTAAAGMLAVPQIVYPGPGEMVDSSGFSVGFTPPAGADYLLLELVAEDAAELREWTVMLPPAARSFQFRQLPAEADAILVPGEAGRTWTIRLTAARIGGDLLATTVDRYRRVITNWVTLGPAQFGVDAISSISQQVSTR